MPLPGESILTAHKLLEGVHAMMCAFNPLEERVLIEKGIKKARDIILDEEMEVLRFGDVTRIADDTFEPYQTINKVYQLLDGIINKEVIRRAIDLLAAQIQADEVFDPFLINQYNLTRYEN
jgi:hypothetical protein